jgi:hypothetical protein
VGFTAGGPGHAVDMTVTDPDVPDPINDPRTTQADPGAYGEGADLASGEDDPAATGEEELSTSQDLADEAGGGEVTGGAFSESPPS